jgi:hypothetical protein
MSNDAFLETLSGCVQAANKLDLSDNNWMPPDGGYTVQIDSVDTGVKVKDGVNVATLATNFLIVDGEFEGKTFQQFCWMPPTTGDPSMGQKALAQLATCLAGVETKDPIEGSAIVEAAVGDALALEVYRTTARKGKNAGKTYTNIRFLNTIETREIPQGETAVNATG